ncbi:MAG TPA: Do family serine endopeptidase [Balneolaceae bacterium]|nr:Do family serine endopeptidase [Balneolaceae bacterium]
MKDSYSSYLLWAVVAVLLVGFYTLDFQSSRASILSLSDFSDLKMDEAEGEPAPVLAKFNNAIVDVAEQATPSVVTVTVTQTVEAQPSPLSLFFRSPRGNAPREFMRRGLGSGVIVSEEGYILTNNHVVENADEIEVELYNDMVFDAKVIGTDPRTDIAVLKIDAEDLNPIPLGNSDKVEVGELVLAIGSPLDEGLAHSVSMGIISAKGRRIGILADAGGYENFIQTDAAINPGNSGGALVNMNGELIGINSAIASQSGGNQGIGFAVPVNIAKRVMKSIIEHGRVIRGFLGITLGGQVDAVMARALGLEKAQGVVVGGVREGGPADEAGLEEGDVIQSINGTPIESWAAFRTAVATSAPGTEIELGIVRDGEKETYTVTLGEYPQELATEQNQPQNQSIEEKTGFRVQNLTPEIARQLGLSEGVEGIVVTDISRTSEAYRQGLKRGDVITAVNREPVSTVSEFNEIMSEVAESEDGVVLLNVVSGGYNRFIAFEL